MSKHIIYNGTHHPIEWDMVLTYEDGAGLKARKGTYYSCANQPPRNIRYFVNHWDVCTSSKGCFSVLDKRGLSVHFLVDNDGTIYQTLDMQHIAWHAGSTLTNKQSLGVEITNAYDLKYQNYYKTNVGLARPVIEDAWVHGTKLKPFLGFYPVQLEALKALWKAVHWAAGIPLEAPLNEHMQTSTGYENEVVYGKFSGFVSHYHISTKKIDCAGLDIAKLLEEIECQS